MSNGSLYNRRTQQVARTLQLDRAAIEIVQALKHQDIPCLFLKGASIARWLYPNELRPYVDVDLLVPCAHWQQAVRHIENLGFVFDQSEPTGGNWYRARDRAWLDLHDTLAELAVPKTQVWETLWNERAIMQLHDHDIPILNDRARLFHVVMHAIQTGNAKTKAAEDVSRAVAHLPFVLWQAAWEVAVSLRAEQRFAASLRLYAESGEVLADRLGAPRHVPFSYVVDAVAQTPGIRTVAAFTQSDWQARCTLLTHWLRPTESLLTALDRGKGARVPSWIRQRQSPMLKFYLWRGWQVWSFIRVLPAALRLRRSSNRATDRQAYSRPWRDD